MKKASSVRAVSRALVALLAGVLIVGLGGGSASAASKRFEQAAFGSFAGAGAVAVDQSGGDVYVLDAGSASVQRFDADGNPVAFSALNGQNTLNGSDAGPDADQTPANAFSFDAASQVAVDASGGATDGTVYVADSNNQVVDIFAASGAYLGQLDGTGTPQGRWADSGAYPCGVAVGADGKVYVSTGMGNQIDRYDPAASPVVEADYDSQIDAAPFGSCGLAVDSTGAVYAAPTIFGASGPLVKFAASDFGTSAPAGTQVAANATAVAVDPTNDHVVVDESDKATEYDNTGGQVGSSFGAGNLSGSHGIAIAGSSNRVYASDQPSTQVHQFAPPATVPDVTLGSATAITDTTATLHATVNPGGAPVTDCHFEYNNAFEALQAPCSPDPGSGSGPVDVSADLTGLVRGNNYTVRVVVTNANGTTTSPDSTVLTTAQPDAETLYVQPITADSATIAGHVNPRNQAGVTYRFEWGTGTSYGNAAPAAPGDVGTGSNFNLVTQKLTGLQPATTYHFRIVATNGARTDVGDDHTFETRPAVEPAEPACPNAAIRAEQRSEYLPDCRAYEQVSPRVKNSIEVVGGGSNSGEGIDGGGSSNGSGFGQASPMGERIAYSTIGALPGSDGDTRVSISMGSRTADGWTTRGLNPPSDPPAFLAVGNLMAISPDLSHSLGISTQVLAPGAIAGQSNVYLRDNVTGSYQLVVRLTEYDRSSADPTAFFAGGSRDFSRVLFQAKDALAPGAPTDQTSKLYEWTPSSLRYIGLSSRDVVGAVGSPLTTAFSTGHWPISDDGTIVFRADEFWTQSPLYVSRDGGAETPVTFSQRPGDSAIPRVVSRFWGASNDGSMALFSSDDPLTVDAHSAADANGGDLYRLNVATGALENLSAGLDLTTTDAPIVSVPGTVEQVPAISDDARTVIFATGHGGGVHGLYINRNGVSRLISTLEDQENPGGFPRSLDGTPVTASGTRMSPNGRWFLMKSAEHPTATATGLFEKLFLYDTTLGRMQCVTCTPSGRRSSFNGLSARSGVEHRLARYVLDDGRVFFETSAAMVSDDVNGQQDVYEWRDGRAHLISSGRGRYGSSFEDASADGTDVFIATREKLVDTDDDDTVDIYDARTDGGFASDDEGRRPDCAGDACQDSAAAGPERPAPSSASSSSEGDVPMSARVRAKLTIARPKAATGTRVTLKVSTSGAGHITASGGGVATASRAVAGRATISVPVRLGVRATATLRRRGRYVAKVRVTFAPSAGLPIAKTVTLTFKVSSNKKGR